jgi:hypothetical protein
MVTPMARVRVSRIGEVAQAATVLRTATTTHSLATTTRLGVVVSRPNTDVVARTKEGTMVVMGHQVAIVILMALISITGMNAREDATDTLTDATIDTGTIETDIAVIVRDEARSLMSRDGTGVETGTEVAEDVAGTSTHAPTQSTLADPAPRTTTISRHAAAAVTKDVDGIDRDVVHTMAARVALLPARTSKRLPSEVRLVLRKITSIYK